MSVKRKLLEEKRKFNSNWKEKYLFTSNNGKLQSMVCLQVIFILEQFNWKRHYCTKHKKTYEKYYRTYRKPILKD